MREIAMIVAVGLALTPMGMGGAALAQQTEPVVGQGSSGSGSAAAPRPKPVPKPVPTLDDTAGTTDANAAAAAKAEAQTQGMVDTQLQYRAKVDKQIADYDAKMEAYRAQVRANEARNAEIRRRNEARAALYKTCVAGDKAACAQYNAGQ